MSKIFIVGGGWAGCSAALIAAKQGAQSRLKARKEQPLTGVTAAAMLWYTVPAPPP